MMYLSAIQSISGINKTRFVSLKWRNKGSRTSKSLFPFLVTCGIKAIWSCVVSRISSTNLQKLSNAVSFLSVYFKIRGLKLRPIVWPGIKPFGNGVSLTSSKKAGSATGFTLFSTPAAFNAAWVMDSRTVIKSYSIRFFAILGVITSGSIEQPQRMVFPPCLWISVFKSLNISTAP